MRSAFQYTTNILFERWPFLVSLRYYQDEILLLIETALQSFFMKKFNSTYAEYFYGYTRKCTANNMSPKRKMMWVVLLTTFLPYLKRKAEKV